MKDAPALIISKVAAAVKATAKLPVDFAPPVKDEILPDLKPVEKVIAPVEEKLVGGKIGEVKVVK